jgi:ABC-type transport system involved in cytochrome c biogenesis permease subunit
MDWWKRLFGADRLIPMILGSVGGIAWLFFTFQDIEDTFSLGSVKLNLLQLRLRYACLILYSGKKSPDEISVRFIIFTVLIFQHN